MAMAKEPGRMTAFIRMQYERLVGYPPIRRLYDRHFRRAMQLSRKVLLATRGQVQAGPFKGMKYPRAAIGSSFPPKLLGTYEKELWPVVEAIVARDYARVVDIGAGEGYYAVGLTLRLPRAHLIAFEAREDTRELLCQTIEMNGIVNRSEVHGVCGIPTLRKALIPMEHTLVVCDVEGAERALLTPDEIPALLAGDILVELHEFAEKGVSWELLNRFTKTHYIMTIASRRRSSDDWTINLDMAYADKLHCMEENRPGVMEWYWMTAKAAASTEALPGLG
jgi:hypothetical protein